MKIFLEDLKTEIKEEDCDITKGQIVCYKKEKDKDPLLVYTLYTKKQLLQFDKEKVERWFETEYREIFEKCTRRIYMGIKMSDGKEPQAVLEELYKLAEEKASVIRDLEEQIAREK